MRNHCLRIAEMNLKLNNFSDSTIITLSESKQKKLEQERGKIVTMLQMEYPGLDPDDILTPVNTKGLKLSTDINLIESVLKEIKEKNDNTNTRQGMLGLRSN